MEFTLSKAQGKFFKALESGKYRYMCFGGGFGGGKSMLICFIIIYYALQHSSTRYAIIRKNRTVLARTTFITFKKVLDLMGLDRSAYTLNRSELKYTFHNGSEVYFLEMDETKDPDFDKVKGIELTAVGIDQCEEVKKEALSILKGRIGRENKGGKVPAFILMTCNPSHNWVQDDFYAPWKEKKLKKPYYFLQALVEDNPWSTKEYIKGLQDLPEAEYKRYVLGDWSYSDDPNQLIRYEWLAQCLLKPSDEDQVRLDNRNLIKYMGVDVARMGKDKTVFTFMCDDLFYDMRVYSRQDTTTTAEKLMLAAKEGNIGYSNIGADVVGLGAGVVDTCYAKDFKIKAFNSGEAPTSRTGHFLFKNKRAESWWALREDIENQRIQILDKPEFKPLIKELLQIYYFVKDKVIQIESKGDMHKRMGHSPDHADSLAICNYMRKNTNLRVHHEEKTAKTQHEFMKVSF